MARATQERTPSKKSDPTPNQANPERDAALKSAIEQIHKRCGDGSIMRLGSQKITPTQTISTGSLSLDNALGVGGIPRGRIIEIFGPESSGKTTLALHVIANAQKNRGVAAFIDAEHALDPLYAKRLGVNLDNLLVSQPDYGEQALEIAHTLISSSAVDVIVIDSVAALVPKAEIDGEMGDHHVGLQARLMSQAMRKLSAVINRSNTSAIFINQIREKIGVMFGSPQTTPGGRALKFYSSVRIDIRRIGQIKDGGDVVGNRTLAKVVKNKCAPPFRNAEFDIVYNKGISWIGDVLDHAVAAKIVNKAGAWYSFQKTRLGQGRENAIRLLETEPTLLLEIETAVLAKLNESAQNA
ncbi:MAG: recombinase RecA [Planctomycetota bacterium]|nr:recombinase RecA [Planctomycetota bacterium]